MTPDGVLQGIAFAQGVLLLVVLILAVGSDIREGRVRNGPCVAGLVLGLLLSYARGGLWAGDMNTASLGTSAAAAGLGFLLFALFYLVGGIGAGDVKLIAAVGALAANVHFMLWTLVCTAFAGVPLAVGALILRGDLKGGLFRSVRGLGRWKYERPAVATDLPAGQSAGAESPAGGTASAAQAAGESPVTVPYAVAIGVGVVLTIWLFIDRGAYAELPFRF